MEGEEDPDIAAAMGFSSFGGTKKRKFDQRNSPKPKPKPDASGANSTPLGGRPKILDEGSLHGNVERKPENPETDGDTVLESTEAIHAPARNAKGKLKQPAATGLAGFLARGQNLPERPRNAQEVTEPAPQEADTSIMVSFGGPPIPKAELNALQQGVKNEQGDIAYFLPSFVEDPWERLEKNKQ